MPRRSIAEAKKNWWWSSVWWLNYFFEFFFAPYQCTQDFIVSVEIEFYLIEIFPRSVPLFLDNLDFEKFNPGNADRFIRKSYI